MRLRLGLRVQNRAPLHLAEAGGVCGEAEEGPGEGFLFSEVSL